MAEVGGLSLVLGLSMSKLESDWIAAEKSVSTNMKRLNREMQAIRLRAEVDITGLDKAKDAYKILEIQIDSINKQIISQKDKVTIATGALESIKEKTGEFSTQTQNATLALKREELALAQLTEKLRTLNQQKLHFSAEDITPQFDKVKQTIDSQISNLNLKNTIIRMRAEIDVTGLDKAKDASKILEIQTKSLNQQIKNQQSILKMTEAVLRETTARTGQFSAETLKATANLESERLELKRLEEELKNAANSQKQLTDSQNAQSKNSLLNGYNNLKSNIASHINEISSAFNGLSAASQSADSAITKSLEIIDSIPQPARKAVAALAAIPLVLKGVENSILSYTKAAAASGDSVYVMSRGMQLSVAEMGKLSTVAKVTGIDINEVNSNLRRLETQFVKSGDSGNLMTKTLSKYNVQLTDINGNLKKGLDLSIALADGLKKAQAEGKGAEFIAAVGGKFWSGDFVTYLEDLKDNIEAANKIVKNGLANPVLAHQVQGNLNAMDLQASQLKASFASAFLPVADEIVPRVTARMGNLTKFLADNKDEIKEFGEAVGKFFGAIEDGADMAFSAVKILHDGVKELKIDSKQKELERSYSFNLNPNLEMYQQTLNSYDLANPTYFAPMLKTLDDTKQKVTEKVTAINKEIEKVGKVKLPEMIGGGGISAALERSFDEEKLEATLETLRKAREIERETNKIIYRMNNTEFDSKKNDLYEWYRSITTAQNTTDAEREAYTKQYHAKLEQLEKEHVERIKEIREEIASKNRTDLENQIAAIEKNQEKWIQAGLPRIEAEKAAEQQKNQAILKLEEEFNSAMDELRQNDLEKAIANCDKEAEAWKKKGIDETKATELAEAQKAKILEEHHKNAERLLREAADIEYGITHEGIEKQLHDIRTANERIIESLKEKGATAEEIAAQVAKAAQQEAEAIENEVQRIKDATKALDDEIFDLTHSQYEKDIKKAYEKADKYREQGVSEDKVQELLSLLIGEANKKKLEASKNSDYAKRPKISHGDVNENYFLKQREQDEQRIQQALQQIQKKSGEQIISQEQLITAARQNEIKSMQGLTEAIEHARNNAAKAKDAFEVIQWGNDDSNYGNEFGSQSAFEVIQWGDVEDNFYDLNENMTNAVQQSQGEIQDSLKMTEQETRKFLESIPERLEELKRQGLSRLGDGYTLTKEQDGFTNSNIDLYNFDNDAQRAGLSLEEVNKLLEKAVNSIEENVKNISNAENSLSDTFSKVREDIDNAQIDDDSLENLTENAISSTGDKFSNFADDIRNDIENLSNTDLPFEDTSDEAKDFAANLESVGDTFTDTMRQMREAISEVSMTTPNIESYNPKLPEVSSPEVAIPTLNYEGLNNLIIPIYTYFESMILEITRLSELTSFISEKLSSWAGNDSAAQSSKNQSINVSVNPNISVNLGGAYVFDEAMKQELTADITQSVVDHIESAVKSMSSRNFSFAR